MLDWSAFTVTTWAFNPVLFVDLQLPGWDHIKLVFSFIPGGVLKSAQQRLLIEHTCAYARWAHMHRFLYVRLSVCLSVCDLTKIQTRPKVTRQKFISLEPFEVASWNSVWWWMLMVSRSCLKLKVIGQWSSSPYEKYDFHALCFVYLICNPEVKGHWVKVKGHWVKVKGHWVKVKGCTGQDQRSHWSKSSKGPKY